MATPDESFDPNTIERESDQVDVCIVGGGTLPILNPPPHPLLEARELLF